MALLHSCPGLHPRHSTAIVNCATGHGVLDLCLARGGFYSSASLPPHAFHPYGGDACSYWMGEGGEYGGWSGTEGTAESKTLTGQIELTTGEGRNERTALFFARPLEIELKIVAFFWGHLYLLAFEPNKPPCVATKSSRRGHERHIVMCCRPSRHTRCCWPRILYRAFRHKMGKANTIGTLSGDDATDGEVVVVRDLMWKLETVRREPKKSKTEEAKGSHW